MTSHLTVETERKILRQYIDMHSEDFILTLLDFDLESDEFSAYLDHLSGLVTSRG